VNQVCAADPYWKKLQIYALGRILEAKELLWLYVTKLAEEEGFELL
jgi:hypothetical protein